MHARPTRIAALLALVIAGLVLAAGTASATPVLTGGSAGAECALPEPTDDDTISILGRICDRRETPQAPVEGVTVNVEDDAGQPIGEATTGADGTFVVDLPGTAIDHLGKTYVVTIDEGSLPEDTAPEIDQPRHRPVGHVPGR